MISSLDTHDNKDLAMIKIGAYILFFQNRKHLGHSEFMESHAR
jgi:hypothetical protein